MAYYRFLSRFIMKELILSFRLQKNNINKQKTQILTVCIPISDCFLLCYLFCSFFFIKSNASR